jgi:hypothetical protein
VFFAVAHCVGTAGRFRRKTTRSRCALRAPSALNGQQGSSRQVGHDKAPPATPIDHHGHDSHAAQAVTMPGHPSPTRQWTARDATPVPASSGPTVPECRAAQESPAEREGVTRTLQGETRVAGDVSDMQPAACSTLNQK